MKNVVNTTKIDKIWLIAIKHRYIDSYKPINTEQINTICNDKTESTTCTDENQTKSKLESEPETNPETNPKTDLETDTETDSETVSETDHETSPETNPKTNPKTDPEIDPDTDPETDPENDLETNPETDLETDTETDSETETDKTMYEVKESSLNYTSIVQGFSYLGLYIFMNDKKFKDENRIRDERLQLWVQIFIADYFKFAQRSNDPPQIYGTMNIISWLYRLYHIVNDLFIRV